MNTQTPAPQTLAAQTIVPLYAGFWRRAAAIFLDGLILLVPNLVLVFILPEGIVQFIANVLVGCTYYAAFHSSAAQATPGKRAFGIKVTDLEGRRIGLGRAIGRYFATWISTVILLVGFLLAAFTGKRQALHDILCGTLVVNRNAQPEDVPAGGAVMPVTAGVWAVIVLLFGVPFFGGIVAAISIPAYQDYVTRSKVADVMNAAVPLKQDIERALSEKRTWTTGPVPIASQHATAAEVTGQGHVIIRVDDRIARGGRIAYVPANTAGAVQWRCTSEDVPKRYLPASCRE